MVFEREREASGRSGRFARAVVAVFLIGVLAGCATVKYGSMPDTSALESTLRAGESTKGDVLTALGPPRGYGMARFNEVERGRVIWFYEFIQAKGSDIDLKMLLVLFDGDKYDGYLWFSSLEKVTVTQE